MLTEITLENFRCFHETQKARLAPLTLLVGENSTGKTSFMAMIRAMWEIAYTGRSPDFKAPPYDLGSFDEIAHSRGARGGQAKNFAASIGIPKKIRRPHSPEGIIVFRAEFARRGTAPAPSRRTISDGPIWIDQTINEQGRAKGRVGTERGEWRQKINRDGEVIRQEFNERLWFRFLIDLDMEFGRPDKKRFMAMKSSPPIQQRDRDSLMRLAQSQLDLLPDSVPYASAPVRSTPQRTYDPARPTRDPAGDYIPMYLAETAAQNGAEWEILKSALEKVGDNAGIFDEIRVYRFGKSSIAPFQLQVRKGGDGRKGPWRNLIDVGYGVSQVLPVITELLRPDAPQLSLWQQPEVHLHPSAQAALATFFCGLAAEGKQLIVETHGDYLLDRVRMDVRDGKTKLKPEDVSVLYFERTGLDVQIYSIRFDTQGNVLDAPQGYRQFFLEEVNRSLGI